MSAKKAQHKPTVNEEVHFVFVEESFDKAAPEIMKLEESNWWPQNSGLTVVRKTPGVIQAGTIFQYKLAKLFLGGWTAEVVNFIPNRLLSSEFRSGLLQGTEEIRVEERANGTKAEYRIRYQVKGFLNKLFWRVFGQRAHNNAIKKILAAFQDHVHQKAIQEQEKKFER